MQHFSPLARTKNFENAPGPEITSEVIFDALTNPFPQTRFVILLLIVLSF